MRKPCYDPTGIRKKIKLSENHDFFTKKKYAKMKIVQFNLKKSVWKVEREMSVIDQKRNGKQKIIIANNN